MSHGCRGVGVVARMDGCREARDLPARTPSWRQELRLTGALAAWLYSLFSRRICMLSCQQQVALCAHLERVSPLPFVGKNPPAQTRQKPFLSFGGHTFS